jgi:hypothetical protein
MKRWIITGFFLFSLVLVEGLISPQQKTILTGTTVAARSDVSIKWENVDGRQVLRVWQLEGPNIYPQISVLRVSNDAYLKFSQDPKGFMNFVNAHKVFSKDVIVAGPWVSLSSVDQRSNPPDWVLTIVHGKKSTMIVSALPQLKHEDSGSDTQ